MESDVQQSNRLFVILAVALLGLICIGLMGLMGVVVLTQQSRRAQEAVAVLPTPTFIPPTFTPTSTITPTPTDTPEPTPTSTLVVNPQGQTAAQPGQAQLTPPPPGATPTNTLVIQPVGTEVPSPAPGVTPTPVQMPEGGGVPPATGNSYLIWIGLVTLVLLAFSAVNRLILTSPFSKK